MGKDICCGGGGGRNKVKKNGSGEMGKGGTS